MYMALSSWGIFSLVLNCAFVRPFAALRSHACVLEVFHLKLFWRVDARCKGESNLRAIQRLKN